jgi:SAM-dependent methyltransferase
MNHPVFARIYAKRSVAEDHLQGVFRRELLEGLSGRVLEVGCGNGLNFAYYPPQVTEVVGVEPEPYLRGRAQIASSKAQPAIQVVEGRAEAVSEAVSGPFDAAVFSLVLCSVPDLRVVLAEAKKVLKEGAAVRFYEHVLSEDRKVARWQQLFAPLWSTLAGGCRPDRDTLSTISEAFAVTDVRSFDFCPGCRIPLGIVAPHILARGTVRSQG